MSSEISMRVALSRQADMVGIEKIRDMSVAVIGVGGIGSNAVHTLASLGMRNLVLFDPDFVGEENIYPGWFKAAHSQSEIPKVNAVAEQVREMFQISLDPRFGVFSPDRVDYFDAFLIGTDTLESRRRIWDNYARSNCNDWYIDARMGGVLSTVYCVNMRDDQQRLMYSRDLTREEEGELPCGMKATSPLTKGWIAGMIGKIFFNISNELEPPYMQRYDLHHGMLIGS